MHSKFEKASSKSYESSFRTTNIEEGYLEFYNPNNWSQCGYVAKDKIVSHVDFDSDTYKFCNRWFAYAMDASDPGHPYLNVGKRTGYATRGEALQAACKAAYTGNFYE